MTYTISGGPHRLRDTAKQVLQSLQHTVCSGRFVIAISNSLRSDCVWVKPEGVNDFKHWGHNYYPASGGVEFRPIGGAS